MYKYYNRNPRDRNIEDCVIRSISLLTNRSWEDIYKELVHFSSKDGYMTDNVEFVEDYLDDRYPRECHYSKSVGEFAYEHPFGKYAVTMFNHITAIIDGVIYDTFDPSDRIMRCAWRIDKG